MVRLLDRLPPNRPERAVSILDHRPDLGADYIAVAAELLARLPGLEQARGRLAKLS